MTGAKTFASNPDIPVSVATFASRNAAAMALALRAQMGNRPLRVALLGGGVFEPLVASALAPASSTVLAVDTSREVFSALRSITGGTGHAEELRSVIEGSWPQSTERDRRVLRTLGINVDLLFDQQGRLRA